MPHSIDRASVRDVIARISGELERLPGSAKGERDLSLLGDATNFDELLGTLEPDSDYLYAFSVAWVAREAMEHALTPTLVEGDLELEQSEKTGLYLGDLHVKGNLDYARDVIVLGSLRVDGAVTQRTAEHNVLIVLGDFCCAAAEIHGRVWVRGRAEMKALVLERYGYFCAVGGTTAEVVVSDDSETGMLASYRARQIVNPSAADIGPDAEFDAWRLARWEYLRRFFVDEAFDESERPTFLPCRLFSLVTAGRPFLRGTLDHEPYVAGTPISPPD